jgi:hypothetical protein
MSKTGQILEPLKRYVSHAGLDHGGVTRDEALSAIKQITQWLMEPIPLRLVCEGCGKLHIDEGEFAEKPHHTHVCQHCGLTWRPAIGPTVGVQFLPGFKNAAKPAAGSQLHQVTIKTSTWEPKLGEWARAYSKDGDIVLLGEFSKLTGRFSATTLDGTPLCLKPVDIKRWIPRINERVTLGGDQVFGVVVDNGFETGPEGLPFFIVKRDDGLTGKAYLSDLKPAHSVTPAPFIWWSTP